MERPLLCAQEAEQPRDIAARPSRQLLRLGHTVMEDNRRAGARLSWSRCLRIPRVL